MSVWTDGTCMMPSKARRAPFTWRLIDVARVHASDPVGCYEILDRDGKRIATCLNEWAAKNICEEWNKTAATTLLFIE